MGGAAAQAASVVAIIPREAAASCRCTGNVLSTARLGRWRWHSASGAATACHCRLPVEGPGSQARRRISPPKHVPQAVALQSLGRVMDSVRHRL